MAITIQCPNPQCLQTVNVDGSIAGRNVKCKKCGTAFRATPTMDGQSRDTAQASQGSDTGLFTSFPMEFGRYRIEKLLGKGGMGAVYLAMDAQLNRKVALKIPFFNAKEEPKRAERFIREARSAASLHHPNICTVFDAGDIHGRPFITMALITGKPLEDLFDTDNLLPVAQVMEIVRKTALAVQEAHHLSIVHRDLKPANIMITPAGEPVIMDFGLAKMVGETDAAEARLTQEGALLGTPRYMAPEQVNGDQKAIGPSTDVYALGVILFEMLTGRAPYSGPLLQMLSQIASAPVPQVRTLRPDVSHELDAVCRKAMAKNPSERYAGMGELAEALSLILSPAGGASATTPAMSVDQGVSRPAARRRQSPDTVSSEAAFPTIVTEAKSVSGSRSGRRPTPRKRTPPSQPSWISNQPRIIWIGAAIFGLIGVLTLVMMMRKPSQEATEVITALSQPAAVNTPNVDAAGERLNVSEPPILVNNGAASQESMSGVQAESKLAEQNNSRTGSTLFRGHQYKIFLEAGLDWKAAKSRCEAMGGHLATISDEQESQFLTTLATTTLGDITNSGVWLGASDETNEGQWTWIDGTPFSYADWSTGQGTLGNGNTDENYLLLLLSFRSAQGREVRGWCDQPLPGKTHVIYYACEWDSSEARPSVDLSQPQESAGDWVNLFNDRDLSGWKTFGKPNWVRMTDRIKGVPAGDGSPGFLMTEKQYSDFELELEVRFSTGSNSGLFLRSDSTGDLDGKSRIEFQLIDDKFPAYQAAPYLSGALHGVFATQIDPQIRTGEWIPVRVWMVGQKIEAWINGQQTLNKDLHSVRDQFASKPWLTRTRGSIGLQLSGTADVEFRNARIRELNGNPQPAAAKAGAQAMGDATPVALFNGTEFNGTDLTDLICIHCLRPVPSAIDREQLVYRRRRLRC